MEEKAVSSRAGKASGMKFGKLRPDQATHSDGRAPHGFAEDRRIGTGNRSSKTGGEKPAAAMIHSGRMQLDKDYAHK